MELLKFLSVAFILLIAMSQPVSAAASKCSFNKSVKQGGSVFDVSSRSSGSCAVQIITVTLRKGRKNIASFKTDVDYLAQSAKTVDLAGDGTPELVVISRTTGGVLTEALDVYWLDGTILRRSPVPELQDKSGYRGGDRFLLEGNLIVRTTPIYRNGDPVGKPTGGTHVLKYGFRDGALTLDIPIKKAPMISVEAAVKNESMPTPPPVEKKTAVSATTAFTIIGIMATESGIEIKADGIIDQYITSQLDKPERIAIDIPDADSTLTGRKIAVNRFGISTVEVGRNKGFMRVVLNTTTKKFPTYEVKSSGSRLRIEFKQ